MTGWRGFSASGPGWPRADRAERYYLTYPGEPEREVTRQEWVDAERDAGFCGSGSTADPSTWSFSGLDGIRGRREITSGGRAC